MQTNLETTEDVAAQKCEDEMRIMQEVMGFSTFSSTHNKKVKGNTEKDNISINKNKNNKAAESKAPKPRQYTQYLHKKGIYDIPLTRQQLEESQQKEAEDKIRKMEI